MRKPASVPLAYQEGVLTGGCERSSHPPVSTGRKADFEDRTDSDFVGSIDSRPTLLLGVPTELAEYPSYDGRAAASVGDRVETA
jgi:hypothetical protein